jgi:hypothetical protein
MDGVGIPGAQDPLRYLLAQLRGQTHILHRIVPVARSARIFPP